MGEIKNDKMSWFHYWIRFYLEERKENKCISAGVAVGGILRGSKLTDGSWGHVPFGFSLVTKVHGVFGCKFDYRN